MLLETTNKTKELAKKINDYVGTPYSFFEKIKRRGVESKRMTIDDVSPNLKPYINTVSDDVSYASVELRENGILIFMYNGLRHFTWAIPYYQLYLYKTPTFNIHAQGKFVLFKDSRAYKEHSSFIKKLFDLKNEFDNAHPHIDSI